MPECLVDTFFEGSLFQAGMDLNMPKNIQLSLSVML
jgi:hypothetical protein